MAPALSISHTNGWACAAVQHRAGPRGCDLERVEARSPAFLEDYLAPAEQAFVAEGPRDDLPRRATLAWSAKEAVMKALGEGLRLPALAVQVAPSILVSHRGWRSFSVLAPARAMGLGGLWRAIGEFVLTLAGSEGEPQLLVASAVGEGAPWA
jgi:4'-phosphopantetheinyl transferase